MVPARNLRRRQCDSYGVWFDETHFREKTFLMAEEDSRRAAAEDEEEEVGTSDKLESGDWLRLGIGGAPVDSINRGGRLMELELFSDRPSASSSLPVFRPPPPAMTPVFPPHGMSFRRDAPWGGFFNPDTAAPPPLQYSFRRLLYPPGSSAGEGGGMRVVAPPRRPQAGVWFLLQAAQNQVREPPLPQIPKSYLRIKDGRMTVRVLMKYLVSKLGLDDESEVEVTCRGEPLLPFLTLQHVRDNIWCLRAAAAEMEVLPDSPATDHVMTLQYGRSRCSSST